MEMETNDRPTLIFDEAIKSEETRRQYRYLLEKFVEFVKKEYSEVLKASDLLQLNDDYLQKQLDLDTLYVKKIKSRTGKNKATFLMRSKCQSKKH
jgi:hypothetical protein